MTAKTANYTPEQVTRMREMAEANGGKLNSILCEALAVEFSKALRSVVAKASRENIYQAKTYERKDGSKVEKKDTTADAIGKILKLDEASTESLTKCNRKALQAIFDALANSVPIDG